MACDVIVGYQMVHVTSSDEVTVTWPTEGAVTARQYGRLSYRQLGFLFYCAYYSRPYNYTVSQKWSACDGSADAYTKATVTWAESPSADNRQLSLCSRRLVRDFANVVVFRSDFKKRMFVWAKTIHCPSMHNNVFYIFSTIGYWPTSHWNDWIHWLVSLSTSWRHKMLRRVLMLQSVH